ncbi:MAG: MmgE/PrpD family protein [Burkholderiales bacterium]|nr:MmgE/PrpD family protein [Burkholderiales bacterium]
MADRSRYTETLAAFCAQLRYGDLPQDVVHRAKLCLLDSIGVMLAGATTAIGKRTLDAALRFDPQGTSTAIGSARTASPPAASLVNGSLLEIFEMQDGWRLGNVHPCVVIPAALSIAEWKKAPGRDVLAAMVAGYEVVNRLSWTMVPRHLARGFLPTGTAGTCGSAVAAGCLLGLDSAHMTQAMGVSAFILPVSTAENLWEGHSIKPLHAGYAARQGVEASLLADDGFEACPIEGSAAHGRGVLEITTGDVDFTRLTARLGEYFTIRDVYFKAIPACRHVHGTAEAVQNAVANRTVKPGDVEAIRVHTYTLSATRLNRYPEPGGTAIAAQFSIPFAAAAALADLALGMAQFRDSRVRDPLLLDLARKVSVHVDPQIDALYPDVTPTRIEIVLRNGETLTSRVDTPKGDPRAPLTDAELIAKFRETAGMALDADAVSRLQDTILRFDEVEDVHAALALLRRGMTRD